MIVPEACSTAEAGDIALYEPFPLQLDSVFKVEDYTICGHAEHIWDLQDLTDLSEGDVLTLQ